MKGMDLKLTPVAVRHLLGPLGMFGLMAGTFWTHIASSNSPKKGYNLPQAAHRPPLSIPSLIIYAICDITVAMKKLL